MAKAQSETWGKIAEEEIERINKRISVWLPMEALWRDATRDVFRAVARSQGNTNPLFQDEEAAARTRWGGVIAFPMIWSQYSRFGAAGFAASGPGFPGVHGTNAAVTVEFLRPIRLGDQLSCKEAVWEQAMHGSDFAGRMLDQISRGVLVDQKTGEVVVDYYNLVKRWERTAAKDRKDSGKGKYVDWKRWVFTDEDIQTLWDDMKKIAIRGATPRFFEDVEIGEMVPPYVTMPYTAREIICYYMANGAPFLMSNMVLFNYLQQHPGLNVPDAATKTPDVPERTHFEAEFAKSTGAPDMYDVTAPRMCWATSAVTNWSGDEAFLREISISARKFNAYGDVTWVTGKVVEKYRQADENLVRIALVWDNQHYRHSWGHALVSLPSREYGPVVLPPPYKDPEGRPHEPAPDNARRALYATEPDIPNGCTLRRNE
jgi:acyl dehydratase